MSIESASHPATQGLPIPRATTAACEVIPPCAVRTPRAWISPWMSSGVVSQRTSTTSSPCAAALLGEVGVEHDRPGGGARRRVEARRDHVDVGVRVDHRVEQLVELARVDARDGLLARDEILAGHLDGDAQRRLRRALAGAGLEEEERAVLDGELDVLHLAVVLLEPLERLDRAAAYASGRSLAHPLDRLRRADAGDDVLALRVDEELAEQARARRWTGCA